MSASDSDYFFGLQVDSLELANLCVVGLPWDKSSTWRMGSREAPPIIRKFTSAEIYDPISEEGVDLTKIWRIYDFGDVAAVASVDEMRKKVHDVLRELYRDDLKFLFLGGDHLATYFSLSALSKLSRENWGLIYLDSHLDLLEEYKGDRYCHGSVVRRLVEEGRVQPRSIIEVGIRSFTHSEVEFASEKGIKVVSTIDFERLSPENAAKQISKLLPKDVKKIYLSIDLDVLDPAFAPGLGYPEPGGISTRSLINFIYGLEELDISAFDIVEFCPKYDFSNLTAVVAGKIILETLGVMKPS